MVVRAYCILIFYHSMCGSRRSRAEQRSGHKLNIAKMITKWCPVVQKIFISNFHRPNTFFVRLRSSWQLQLQKWYDVIPIDVQCNPTKCARISKFNRSAVALGHFVAHTWFRFYLWLESTFSFRIFFFLLFFNQIRFDSFCTFFRIECTATGYDGCYTSQVTENNWSEKNDFEKNSRPEEFFFIFFFLSLSLTHVTTVSLVPYVRVCAFSVRLFEISIFAQSVHDENSAPTRKITAIDNVCCGGWLARRWESRETHNLNLKFILCFAGLFTMSCSADASSPLHHCDDDDCVCCGCIRCHYTSTNIKLVVAWADWWMCVFGTFANDQHIYKFFGGAQTS